MHLISASQFTNRESLEFFFRYADLIEKNNINYEDWKPYKPLETNSIAKNKILATLFLEPSTRTRLSFESSMYQLGGQVISVSTANSSSTTKGESLEDMVSTVSNYADIIVLRTPFLGSVEKASQASNVPVINAGDGTGEHPTQALLDLYTIRKYRSLDSLKVMICGDLLHGRTIHSLVKLLSRYENLTLCLTSPNRLSLPDELVECLRHRGVNLLKYKTIRESLEDKPDVVYMTRLQKERMVDYSIHEDRWKQFCLTPEDVNNLPDNSLIMHPMPRNEEIPKEIDSNHRSLYLKQQPKSGLAIRKALIYSILHDKVTYNFRR